MSVECTVCESWQEECHLQGGHYFRAQDPIPASCHQHSLYYRKLNRKKRQITECYLLLLLFHGFKDYQERWYEVSARKAVCYHLDTVYEIENIDIRSGGGKKCRKWLQLTSHTSVSEVTQVNLIPKCWVMYGEEKHPGPRGYYYEILEASFAQPEKSVGIKAINCIFLGTYYSW